MATVTGYSKTKSDSLFLVTAWAPNTAYVAGQLVMQSGILQRRKTAGTSGSTFDQTQWDAIGAGGTGLVGQERYLSGNWYDKGGVLLNNAPGLNRQVFQRFYTAKGFGISALAVDVTTVASGGTARLGIYAESGGLPAAQYVEAPAIDTSVAGARETTLAATVTIPADSEFFLSYLPQGAAATIRSTSSSDAHLPILAAGAPTSTSGGNAGLLDSTARSGAMPATASTSTLNALATVPQIRFKVA